MKSISIALVLVLGCTLSADQIADCTSSKKQSEDMNPSDGIQVHLKPSKSTYLIGEPVLFTVTLRNNTKQDIRAWVVSLKNQVQVFVSNGGAFERYEDRMADIGKVVPSVETLAPGKSKSYEIKILYSIWTKDQKNAELAFPFTGTYCVQVKYPLFPDRKMIESNIVHTKFKKPEGDDATIWKQINRPEALRFLQSGRLNEDEEDLPFELASLMEKFPKSPYVDGFKHTLRLYYQQEAAKMYPRDLKSDPWMQRLRKLLDIEFQEESAK